MSNEDGNDLRVLVVLEADTIVVTMPGTNSSINYRKLHDTPWLVSSDIRDDPDSPHQQVYIPSASVDRS
jgi:hypothetical protein